MMKTHLCPYEGDIPHHDDSVLLNSLPIVGIHFSVIHPPFRTLLGFPSFLYVSFAPRSKTHIPSLRSPNQGKTKKQKQIADTGESKQIKLLIFKLKKTPKKPNPNPQNTLKGLFWIWKPRVIEWIGVFEAYTFFRHRFRSAPLFLPHKRKANICLMVNSFGQLLPFKLLQGCDDYLERRITDHLDRLCHVDPLWSLILNSVCILIVQATFTWALLSGPSGNRASKYICANSEKELRGCREPYNTARQFALKKSLVTTRNLNWDINLKVRTEQVAYLQIYIVISGFLYDSTVN